jgi:hypothetical protein
MTIQIMQAPYGTLYFKSKEAQTAIKGAIPIAEVKTVDEAVAIIIKMSGEFPN